MKPTQRDALLQYLEFHLLKFVEQMEENIDDPNKVGEAYDRAYQILADFEVTLAMQNLIDQAGHQKNPVDK